MPIRTTFFMTIIILVVAMGLYQLGFLQDSTAFNNLDSRLKEFDSTINPTADVENPELNLFDVQANIASLPGLIVWFFLIGLQVALIILINPLIAGDIIRVIPLAPEMIVIIIVSAITLIEMFGIVLWLARVSEGARR